MRKNPLGGDVTRCRADMAKLLTHTLETTCKIERRLNVSGGWQQATAQIDLDTDPVAALRIEGALLLRKARIHTVAVLRANETSNLHSLAVQMRPILECAGQVVFKFMNAFIAPDLLMSPESAIETLEKRLNADFYQTLRSRTRGQVSHKELREMATEAATDAAASVGAEMPERQKSWSLRHTDKVSILPNGRAWYNYLSNHFTHSNSAEWKGLSWRGGVMSIDRAEDEFAFLGLMSYLVEQVASMNAAAALCPVAGDTDDQWGRWVEPMLVQLNEVRQASKWLSDAAKVAVIG